MTTPDRERSGTPPGDGRRAAARVLVVDDSPYTRQTLKAMAEQVPGVGVVDLAGNGQIALAKALRRPPDLVVLDLAMPVMDGLTFLRVFRGRSDVPVLVVSSHADLGNVEKALELGASGFVFKPEDPYRNLSVIAEELALKISRWVGDAPAGDADARRGAAEASSFPVIAIGSSSGGPSTVQYLLSSLPAEMRAAVLIAQHMPPSFTEAFAKRLGSLLPIAVREARHGEPVRAGEVLVSPGGYHMLVRRGDGEVCVALEPGGDALWVPSVDRLFQSCSEVFGRLVTAVVLTGMGRDGADGVRDVKARGGRTLAESAETAAIYGMPREAAATGCVDEVLALPEIAVRLIRTAALRPSRTGPGSTDDPSPSA